MTYGSGNNMGLVQAARQLEAYGRGPDRQLAHISPDEAEFLDYVQGGRRENPHTGLPEYSLFGKILKTVARVAGAVGGFAIGGPAGAALGAGAATKLTGGSWKDALTGAALAGVGGELGQGIGGGGWSAVGNGTALSGALGGATAAEQAGLQGAVSAAAPGLTGASTDALAAAAGVSSLGGAAPSGLGSFLAPIGGYGGAAAGLGALMTPMSSATGPEGVGGPPPGFGGNINLNVAPLSRAYRPYQGDYSKFGQPVEQGGSGGWQFFDEINPKPTYLADGGRVRRYGLGGGVMAPRGPGGGLGGLGMPRNPGIPSQIEAPHMDDPMMLRAQARDTSPAAQREDLRRAAILGYINARDGGSIHGPGSGKSDDIPAMLSNNEHVWAAQDVADLGDGDSDTGHKRMEELKAEVRRRAGRKHVHRTSGSQPSVRSLAAKVM